MGELEEKIKRKRKGKSITLFKILFMSLSALFLYIDKRTP